MDQQAHYWVWMKRRQILNSIKDSWEEKAFMEDASGQLGGCIWPPRSYSCSFCRREFRSAQALGGHMNVHRRDRARLKQSLGPFDDNNDPFQPQSNHVPSSTTHLRSLEFHFSPEIRTLGCDLDLTSSVSLSSSRVSALSTQESFNDHHGTIASPFSSSSSSNKVQQHPKGYPNSTYKPTGSDSNDPEAEKIINPRGEGVTNSSKNSFTGADLFTGFNSTSCQNPTTGSCSDHEAISTCKRLKTAVSTLSLLMYPCSNDRGSLQSGGSSSVDEIDLELRLGEPPKVK